MANKLTRPRPNARERLEVQALQGSTLNGQAAREELAKLDNLPGPDEKKEDQAPVEAAESDTLPLADTTTGATVTPASAPDPVSNETSIPVPVPTTPEVDETVQPARHTSSVPATPASVSTVATPAAPRRGPGRPTRSTNQAAPPINEDQPKEETTAVRILKDQAFQLRRAKVDLEESGRKVSALGLVQEAITFYLDHLRAKGQIK